MELRHLEDLEVKDDLINESMNHKCVCRTAPAKPGILIITSFFPPAPASRHMELSRNMCLSVCLSV